MFPLFFSFLIVQFCLYCTCCILNHFVGKYIQLSCACFLPRQTIYIPHKCCDSPPFFSRTCSSSFLYSYLLTPTVQPSLSLCRGRFCFSFSHVLLWDICYAIYYHFLCYRFLLCNNKFQVQQFLSV